MENFRSNLSTHLCKVCNWFNLFSSLSLGRKMMSTPSMSKQSDGRLRSLRRINRGASKGVRKLCVLGGLKYVFEGSAAYTSYTDWR